MRVAVSAVVLLETFAAALAATGVGADSAFDGAGNNSSAKACGFGRSICLRVTGFFLTGFFTGSFFGSTGLGCITGAAAAC